MYPLKGQFRSGEPVELEFEISGARAKGNPDNESLSLVCAICLLDREIERHEVPVTPAPDGLTVVRLTVGPYDTEFAGYGVDAELYAGTLKIDALSTAFDVADNWRKATRYGFLSDFDSAQLGDGEDVRWMVKLHLNLVQFYDWMYRHDELVGEEETYTDLMGRVVNRKAVEEKIGLCRAHGMKAVAYGAIYAASKAFAERHPDWRLYTSSGDPYDFIGIFSIMNTSPDSPWQDHIVGQYREAIERMGFDGIHMDTYGFPKTGWSRLNGVPRLERLDEHFPVLISRTRAALSDIRDDVCLIFNNVGNWPVDAVARADQDAVYVEVWKPHERYCHLREIVAGAQLWGEGKNVILAAYLKPFREPGSLGAEGAINAFRLLNAVVTAHGAFHLLHGENGGVLTQGYYVDHSLLEADFRRTVRDYCDFGVRYGHVTHDPALRDVSMTHADGDNLEYAFSGFTYSTYGEAGKVWTVIRESRDCKLIHFINLTGVEDDCWNKGKERPAPVEGRSVSIAVEREIGSLLLVSPDRDGGRPIQIAYRMENGPRGLTAVAELPVLQYWDLLIVRCIEARQSE